MVSTQVKITRYLAKLGQNKTTARDMVQDIRNGDNTATQALFHVREEYRENLVQAGLIEALLDLLEELPKYNSLTAYLAALAQQNPHTGGGQGTTNAKNHLFSATTWLEALNFIVHPGNFRTFSKGTTENMLNTIGHRITSLTLWAVMMDCEQGQLLGDRTCWWNGMTFWIGILHSVVCCTHEHGGEATRSWNSNVKLELIQKLLIPLLSLNLKSSAAVLLECRSAIAFSIQQGSSMFQIQEASEILGLTQNSCANILDGLTKQQELSSDDLPVGLVLEGVCEAMDEDGKAFLQQIANLTVPAEKDDGTVATMLVDWLTTCPKEFIECGGFHSLLDNVLRRILQARGMPDPGDSSSSLARDNQVIIGKLIRLLKSKLVRNQYPKIAENVVAAIQNCVHPRVIEQYDQHILVEGDDLMCAKAVSSGVLEAILMHAYLHPSDAAFHREAQQFMKVLNGTALKGKTSSVIRKVTESVQPLLKQSYSICTQVQAILDKAQAGRKLTPEEHSSLPEALEFCIQCMKTDDKKGLKVCAKCKSVRYCSRDCQLKHWKAHKAECKAIQKATPSSKTAANISRVADDMLEKYMTRIFVLASLRGYNILDCVILLDFRPSSPTFDVVLTEDYLKDLTDPNMMNGHLKRYRANNVMCCIWLQAEGHAIQPFVPDDADGYLKKYADYPSAHTPNVPKWQRIQRIHDIMFQESCGGTIEEVRSDPESLRGFLEMVECGRDDK